MRTKYLVLVLFIVLSCFSIAKNISTVQETNQNNQHSELSLIDQETQQQLNSVLFEHEGQWKDIQKSQNAFHWDQIDQAYSNAQKNKLSFEWIVEIDSQRYPQWTKSMSIEQKEQSLLHFFSTICERYENVKNFILKVSTQAEGIRLAGEISKDCAKKHFLIKQKVERYNQLAQQQNVQGANQQENGYAISQNLSGNENNKQTITNSRLLQTTPTEPVASFTTVGINFYLKVDASASTGPVSLTTYTWSWGDGSTQSGASAIKNHTYSKEGIYLVTLIVQDSAGVKSKITEKAVMLSDQKPGNVVKAWKEQITLNTKTTSNAKNYIIISKLASNDGTITTRRFFSKSTLRGG